MIIVKGSEQAFRINFLSPSISTFDTHGGGGGGGEGCYRLLST